MTIHDCVNEIDKARDQIRCHREAIKRASSRIAYLEGQIANALGEGACVSLGRIYFVRDGKLHEAPYKLGYNVPVKEVTYEEAFPWLVDDDGFAVIPAESSQDVS